MSEQQNFNTYETAEAEPTSLCGYAGKYTHKGSSLRECTISGYTSCPCFNMAMATHCFIKLNHENYLKNMEAKTTS